VLARSSKKSWQKSLTDERMSYLMSKTWHDPRPKSSPKKQHRPFSLAGTGATRKSEESEFFR